MQILETIVTWTTTHATATATIIAIIWEIFGRLTPTEKRASLLSWAGKLTKLGAEFLFTLSDALGKIIPDKRK